MSQQAPDRVKRSALWRTFISLQEAKETAGGIEWWAFQDHLGRSVDVVSQPIIMNGVPNAAEYPVFKSDEGWMYIGDWMERNGDWIEHGFGCCISCVEGSKYQGLMYIGDYTKGERHGNGKRFWLPDSKVWKNNEVAYSPLEDPTTKKPIPFNCEGQFHYNDYYGTAIVELQDTSRRKGEWKHGAPHGDFFQDHELLP